MISVGGRKIEGVVEIYLICTSGKTTAQHSSQTGSTDDWTGERRYLQGPHPSGRQPLAIHAEGRDESSGGHGHKAVGNVINLGVAQAIRHGAFIFTLRILRKGIRIT